MSITKAQIIQNFGKPVSVDTAEGTQLGTIYRLNQQQTEGYLNSEQQQAYIVLTGDDPEKPTPFPLDNITLE